MSKRTYDSGDRLTVETTTRPGSLNIRVIPKNHPDDPQGHPLLVSTVSLERPEGQLTRKEANSVFMEIKDWFDGQPWGA
jgi:hypothetical protein